MMKFQKSYLWSGGELAFFITLFYMTNLFIACMALIGCLIVQWVAMSNPSEGKTTVILCGTIFTAAILSVCGLDHLNQAGSKMTWPEWYVFGQSSKAATPFKASDEADKRELLAVMNKIAVHMLEIANGTAKANAMQTETNETLQAMCEEAESRHFAILGKLNEDYGKIDGVTVLSPSAE